MTGVPTRAELLAGMAIASGKLRAVTQALDTGDLPGPATALYQVLSASLADATARYLAWLPRIAVARCPFTGAVVRRAIDTGGLDGPWWNYDAPIRPVDGEPATLILLRGAMQLARDVETTPFLVLPGPGAPYILPALVASEEITAVITSLAVGRHRAYTISYFSCAPLPLTRFNTWGAAKRAVEGPSGPVWLLGDEPTATEMDFDLRPWIDGGKLLWIAPDDPQVRLRSDADACPYLDLLGRRTMVRVQDGRTWTDGDDLG